MGRVRRLLLGYGIANPRLDVRGFWLLDHSAGCDDVENQRAAEGRFSVGMLGVSRMTVPGALVESRAGGGSCPILVL